MARSFLALTLGTALAISSLSAGAEPSRISFAGGDGSSPQKAVVIKGATEETGIRAEYAWLAQHFAGYKMLRQSLTSSNGHSYDVLEITTREGEKRPVFFDITEFFGK